MTHIVLSLGSNLGDSEKILNQAISELSASIEKVKVSHIIETKPWGLAEQPNFFNAVLSGEYNKSAVQLLDFVHEIENKHNRVRQVKWGPRTLDIDIIVFGQEMVDEPNLVIPHPFAHERAFVLKPWLEIEPEAKIPGKGKVADLLELIE